MLLRDVTTGVFNIVRSFLAFWLSPLGYLPARNEAGAAEESPAVAPVAEAAASADREGAVEAADIEGANAAVADEPTWADSDATLLLDASAQAESGGAPPADEAMQTADDDAYVIAEAAAVDNDSAPVSSKTAEAAGDAPAVTETATAGCDAPPAIAEASATVVAASATSGADTPLNSPASAATDATALAVTAAALAIAAAPGDAAAAQTATAPAPARNKPQGRKVMISGFDMQAEIAKLAERIIEPVAAKLTEQEREQIVGEIRDAFERFYADRAAPQKNFETVAIGILEPVQPTLTDIERKRGVDRLSGAMAAFCQGLGQKAA